jgi:thiol-disulfide isomerase/thioredoxin
MMPTLRRFPYLPQVLAFVLIPVLAVAGAPAAPGGEAAAQVAVPTTASTGVVAESPADLESAIAQVRALYFAHDFHHGAAEGEAALERWPESSELVSWTLANLTRSAGYGSPRSDQAVARAESLVESRPDDVWGAIALVHALTYHTDRRGEALEASLRPLELAPTLPEAVWVRGVVLHQRLQYQEVANLIEEKWLVVDRQWGELLVLKGNAYQAMRFEGSERAAEGLEILARVREHDPENVNAHYLASLALLWDRQRADEGAALMERAAALSPGSIHIARDRWRAISDQPGLEPEEKKALIRVSASEILERRGQYPGTLSLVAQVFGFLGSRAGLEELAAEGAALEDRVLAAFPDTEDAERVLSSRWQRLSGRLIRGEAEDTVSARAELASMLWSFIHRPSHLDARILGDAYMRLFDHARRDETVSPDTLLFLARGAAEHGARLPHAQLASGLAERGVHLDAARELARDGVDAAEEYTSRFTYDTPGEAADALDWRLTDVYAAMGYVELKAGNLEAAREAMDRALELKPYNTRIQFRAGALAEAEGDLEGAEIHYAWGEREERMGPPGVDKPNREALERIYTERHGSMEGYEEFVAEVMDRDRERRWQRVANTRIEEPRDLPAIGLEWLDGGHIGADELDGRIVVINFWGVWCGPCVVEAPQIQQLHEKYRDDPGVVFLTINAFDLDLDKVRTWMADNEYDYPVLVDDGFATPHGVRWYPTTWFADRDGRIVFEHRGASAAVFEEFVWRVEMLQAEASLSAAAAQLLHLLDQRLDDEAVELGAQLVREHPEDAALHALYVISLSQYHGWKEAMRLSEEYVARWPDDAWVQVARGKLVLDPTRSDEAIEAAARARQLAPEDAEIARHAMSIYSAHLRHDQAIALADSVIVSGRATAGLRLGKASALRSMATLPGRPDTAAARLAQQELESAVAETPPSAAVYLAAAERFLWDRRTADALPLLERAVELSPHSDAVRRAYWRGISARTDITADEKRAMIDADIDAYLDARQHAVGALTAVAEHHRSLRDDERFHLMADRIQQEHPGTMQAARSAFSRASMTFNAAREQATTRADSMAATRHFRDMLWPITAMPGANSSVLSSAYSGIYFTLEQDSTSSADELFSVFERLEEHSPWPSARRRHVSLPAALAERGSRLDYAEQLARAGLDPLEDAVEWSRQYATVDEYAEWLDQAKSDHHATIGWVLFHKGEIAEAKRELEKAHEALNTAPTPPYRLGRIAETEGDIEEAERWYATGRGRESWDRRSSEALEELYLAQNESLDGFDEYLAVIDERDLARRRARVESSRIAEPEPLPDFEHDWMDGGRFSSESLKGKVAVINFWGVWCGPCVREAPEIQEFAEKYRDHPDVVFITVANDMNPETTRDFMVENGYDFPVIFDEGLARMANIFAWPTTLFVDRDGRIVFSYLGASLWLVEEYTWRIEALLGGPLAGAGAETDS